MMILHYLGLDHIGHTAGPRSPLVSPKLFEMDNIIKKIYTHLEKQVRFVLIISIFVTVKPTICKPERELKLVIKV